MRIKGAGGCQDIRLYETDFQTAWQLIFDCMGQCGIEVQQVDNEHHVAHGRKKSMYYDITLRDMEDGTVQIYFDQHKSTSRSIPSAMTRTPWTSFQVLRDAAGRNARRN